MAEQKNKVQKTESTNVEKAERTRSGRVYIPSTDIYETADKMILIADMPGASSDSIHVTLEHDLLTIEAQVEFKMPEGYELVYNEYGIGDYYRSFTLNELVDRDKISAHYKNGVLELVLPKIEPAKPRQISIQVG
jgi:HSP20 family protein